MFCGDNGFLISEQHSCGYFHANLPCYLRFLALNQKRPKFVNRQVSTFPGMSDMPKITGSEKYRIFQAPKPLVRKCKTGDIGYLVLSDTFHVVRHHKIGPTVKFQSQ